MPRSRPLTWLLALLLCWQGVAAVAAAPAMLTGGSELHDRHHAGMATTDCAQHPEHCQRADNPGPHHCGQQCLHCPAPTAGQPALILPVLVPAPASPPDAVATNPPPHPGFEIYRPPTV